MTEPRRVYIRPRDFDRLSRPARFVLAACERTAGDEGVIDQRELRRFVPADVVDENNFGHALSDLVRLRVLRVVWTPTGPTFAVMRFEGDVTWPTRARQQRRGAA